MNLQRALLRLLSLSPFMMIMVPTSAADPNRDLGRKESVYAGAREHFMRRDHTAAVGAAKELTSGSGAVSAEGLDALLAYGEVPEIGAALRRYIGRQSKAFGFDEMVGQFADLAALENNRKHAGMIHNARVKFVRYCGASGAPAAARARQIMANLKNGSLPETPADFDVIDLFREIPAVDLALERALTAASAARGFDAFLGLFAETK